MSLFCFSLFSLFSIFMFLLRKRKKNGLLHSNIYREIYPTGSQPARLYLYGLPKLHKVKDAKTNLIHLLSDPLCHL